MTNEKTLALADLLPKIESIPWGYALYIPSSDTKWQSDMTVMVLDPDVDDDEPKVAIDNGMKYALMISNLQDVIQNLRMQKANPDIDDFIKAVEFYYKKRLVYESLIGDRSLPSLVVRAEHTEGADKQRR